MRRGCLGSGLASPSVSSRCVSRTPFSTSVRGCSVNVTGSPSDVVAISHASIACYSEGAEDLSEAPVSLDDSLNIRNSSYLWEGICSSRPPERRSQLLRVAAGLHTTPACAY